jgi:hypothetical protein
VMTICSIFYHAHTNLHMKSGTSLRYTSIVITGSLQWSLTRT